MQLEVVSAKPTRGLLTHILGFRAGAFYECDLVRKKQNKPTDPTDLHSYAFV